jgi:hypothetical protein
MNEDNPPSIDGGDLLSGVNELIIYFLYLCIMENKLRLLRRLYAIENLIEYRLDDYVDMILSNNSYRFFKFCDKDEDYFYEVLVRWVIEQMYYNYFSDIDDTSEEWSEMYKMMEEYIDKLYSKKIKDFFNNRCSQR